MYIIRKIEDIVISAAKQFPVITITGPRQSGKTTLVKNIFKNKPYVNLELPDVSERIQQDPRSFFNKYKDGVVIDEIQRLPELMRYIQGIVDEHKQPGMFVLTGSNQFMLLNQVTESLAGRVALFKLLPFSISEFFKKWFNKGLDARYYYFRDNHGNETDLIIPQGHMLRAVEIKSSQTFHKDFLKGINQLKKIYPERCKNNLLIYDGEDIGIIKDTEVIDFRNIEK